MPELIARIHPRIDSIAPADFAALYPGTCEGLDLIRLTQSAGMDGFDFGSIVVRDGDKPVLHIPLFNVPFRLAGLVDGFAGNIVRGLETVVPGLLRPKLLGVGIVEGEWGQIGIAADLDPAIYARAAELAEKKLREYAGQTRSSMTVYLNFTPRAVEAIPRAWRKTLARIDTIPCARLAIDFADVEGYFGKLSKATRKDIRRKARAGESLRFVEATDVTPWLADVHRLYLATVARAELSLGIQRPAFFERVCREVAGAFYMLYFKGETLIGFNLLIENDGILIDKYFCMDEEAGRGANLYFVSWLKNVEICCARKLKIYHAGPGAEGTKARLGASFIPSITLFRHRNRLVHFVLSRLRGLLAYSPAVSLDGSNIVNPAPEANPLKV